VKFLEVNCSVRNELGKWQLTSNELEANTVTFCCCAKTKDKEIIKKKMIDFIGGDYTKTRKGSSFILCAELNVNLLEYRNFEKSPYGYWHQYGEFRERILNFDKKLRAIFIR
jgi:hypothetical protein